MVEVPKFMALVRCVVIYAKESAYSALAYLAFSIASVPQTCRATAKPLRVSSRSLSPFGLEILTS